jgi:hypothetical protein
MSKRTLLLFASAILVLNLLDAVFTVAYTTSGLATEFNPLMDVALKSHPVVFVLAKITMVSLCVWLLWRLRHRALATGALLGATAMYFVLLGYHLSAMPMLVATVR